MTPHKSPFVLCSVLHPRTQASLRAAAGPGPDRAPRDRKAAGQPQAHQERSRFPSVQRSERALSCWWTARTAGRVPSLLLHIPHISVTSFSIPYIASPADRRPGDAIRRQCLIVHRPLLIGGLCCIRSGERDYMTRLCVGVAHQYRHIYSCLVW